MSVINGFMKTAHASSLSTWMHHEHLSIRGEGEPEHTNGESAGDYVGTTRYILGAPREDMIDWISRAFSGLD